MKAPVFVKVEEYQSTLELVEKLDSKITKAREIIGRINELKNAEDSEIRIWQENLAEVERKIDFIRKALSAPENV